MQSGTRAASRWRSGCKQMGVYRSKRCGPNVRVTCRRCCCRHVAERHWQTIRAKLSRADVRLTGGLQEVALGSSLYTLAGLCEAVTRETCRRPCGW